MTHWLMAPLSTSPAYERVEALLGGDGVVFLDGGVATELQRIRSDARAGRREPWGTWALYQAPDEVREVHRRYAACGCDVVSTNTWAILESAKGSRGAQRGPSGMPTWTETAQAGVRLARQAVAETAREGECAVAFCINGGLGDSSAAGQLELLTWVWSEEPPDLVIVETLEAFPEPATLAAIKLVTEFGLPVWVSFRRCAGGMCSVDGTEVRDPEPDAFARALRQLETLGVKAVLTNCVPAGRVDGALASLRGATSLPIGCYPNLGQAAGDHWEFDAGTGPLEYADRAERWHAAGARIIGGCCGVTPAHIKGVQRRLRPVTAAATRRG